MTSDILSSLRDEENPLGILIESYLEKCINDHKKAVKNDILNHISKFKGGAINDVEGLIEFINNLK